MVEISKAGQEVRATAALVQREGFLLTAGSRQSRPHLAGSLGGPPGWGLSTSAFMGPFFHRKY